MSQLDTLPSRRSLESERGVSDGGDARAKSASEVDRGSKSVRCLESNRTGDIYGRRAGGKLSSLPLTKTTTTTTMTAGQWDRMCMPAKDVISNQVPTALDVRWDIQDEQIAQRLNGTIQTIRPARSKDKTRVETGHAVTPSIASLPPRVWPDPPGRDIPEGSRDSTTIHRNKPHHTSYSV